MHAVFNLTGGTCIEGRLLLDLAWEDRAYVDTVLPFSLRSAPKIVNAIVDTLQWVMVNKGLGIVFHYLDDFYYSWDPPVRIVSASE
jgi:hypothetical protein